MQINPEQTLSEEIEKNIEYSDVTEEKFGEMRDAMLKAHKEVQQLMADVKQLKEDKQSVAKENIDLCAERLSREEVIDKLKAELEEAHCRNELRPDQMIENLVDGSDKKLKG